MFDHEGTAVISPMRDITVGVFENLNITSPMDVDKKLAYTQRILRRAALKKYREFLVTCMQLAKELLGDERTLSEMSGISTDNFWTWDKIDNTGYDVYDYLAQDKRVNFDRELWFELEKCMWRKHFSVQQDHMKCICNDVVKLCKIKILFYADRMCDMNDLAKHVPPPSMKGESAEADIWTVRNQEYTTSEVRLVIKDGIPSSMQDDLEEHPEDYHSLTY